MCPGGFSLFFYCYQMRSKKMQTRKKGLSLQVKKNWLLVALNEYFGDGYLEETEHTISFRQRRVLRFMVIKQLKVATEQR